MKTPYGKHFGPQKDWWWKFLICTIRGHLDYGMLPDNIYCTRCRMSKPYQSFWDVLFRG